MTIAAVVVPVAALTAAAAKQELLRLMTTIQLAQRTLSSQSGRDRYELVAISLYLCM